MSGTNVPTNTPTSTLQHHVRPGQRLSVGDAVSLDSQGRLVKHNSPHRSASGVVGIVMSHDHVNCTAVVTLQGSVSMPVAPEPPVPGNRYCQTERLDRLLEKLQELRGISKACSPCPVRLSCLAEQVIGYWCPKCCCYYIKEVDKRLECDAYVTPEAVEKGLCPTCDGGRKTEVIRGFALDWIEE
jgi:hypothetical protein